MTPFERILGWLVKALQSDGQEKSLLRRIIVWIGRLVLLADIGYLVTVFAILAVLTNVGEKHWLVAAVIYMPATIWLAPMAGLIPATLLFRPKAIIWLLGPPALVFFYMDYTFNPIVHEPNDALVFFSNNCGSRKIEPLTAYMEEHQPEIVAFQECGLGLARMIARANPDFAHTKVTGEFYLMSQHPILSDEPIVYPDLYRAPIAVRHVIDYEGTHIVLYNVHFPSPRRYLSSKWGKYLILGWRYDKGIYSADHREQSRQQMADRREWARRLLAKIDGETEPVLVVGDFNMPSRGYLYQRYAENLNDMFKQGGRGFGYTFPGINPNPVTFFEPWLRIDYIFASDHWVCPKFEVEPSRKAQHRGNLAYLLLDRGTPKAE